MCYWAPEEVEAGALECQVRHAFPEPIGIRLGGILEFTNRDGTFFVGVETTPMPEWMSGQAAFTISHPDPCATEAGRAIPVANAAELTSALAEAMPGDRIVLADGVYSGNYVIDRNGTEADPIAICG